jgi:hypothetical protein
MSPLERADCSHEWRVMAYSVEKPVFGADAILPIFGNAAENQMKSRRTAD